MRLEVDGAELHSGVLLPDELHDLIQALPSLDNGAPGTRIGDLRSLDQWIGRSSPAGRIVAATLGPQARPVRAILFDKTAETNWAVGWHQDRTIAVEVAGAAEGFKNWNRKDGIIHVEPPFEFLETMVTLRVHIDPVDADNGPLLISPGTHRLGRLSEQQILDAVHKAGRFACLAHPGDVWAYKTSILHSSGRVAGSGRRRVLQADYSAAQLPVPLRWALAPEG